MKKTNIALTAFAVLGFGTMAFAVQTYEEALHGRKQSIRDWETVEAALRKCGVKEDHSAYKRVHEALKRNETRLKHLEKEGSRGYKSYAEKAQQVARTAGTAAAGTGLLGRLGGMFGGAKETHAEAVKAEAKHEARKVDEKAHNLKTATKKKARSWGVRGIKRSKTQHPVKHEKRTYA